MIYILMIWTVVSSNRLATYHDWRPVGEFHDYSLAHPDALAKCQTAGRQLGFKPEDYRCVRSK